MSHGTDANSVSVVMKANAIVADPQPELRRFDALEALDVAFTSLQITGQRVEDTEGGRLIDGAKLTLGLVVPDDVLAHAYRPVLCGSGGVRPIRAKSSRESPNSARISS